MLRRGFNGGVVPGLNECRGTNEVVSHLKLHRPMSKLLQLTWILTPAIHEFFESGQQIGAHTNASEDLHHVPLHPYVVGLLVPAQDSFKLLYVGRATGQLLQGVAVWPFV